MIVAVTGPNVFGLSSLFVHGPDFLSKTKSIQKNNEVVIHDKLGLGLKD